MKPKQKFSLTYGPAEAGDYRDTWQVFRIMAEFVSGYQFLSNFHKEVTIFGSARTKPRSKYYSNAVKLGKLLGRNKYTTITGGGPGIMEAANMGAHDTGGESVGINIQLPFEQRINKYVKKSIAFHYFFTRKVILSTPSDSFVFFPGGYGTLDELFEILDRMEVGLMDKVPVILIGKKFWQPLLDFLNIKAVKQSHYLNPRSLELISLIDSADDAFKIIKKSKRKPNICSHLSLDNIYCRNQINWRIFKVMAEIVDGFDFLTGIKRDITILGTKSIKKNSFYYKSAYELGKKLAKKKYTVVTGGGSGVMEAANQGAFEVKGESIGIYTHTFDQGPVNKFLTKSLSFGFSYTRKLILTAPSQAFVFFPGGYGTLDMFFEVLTLIQTGKMGNIPVILFSKNYWQPLLKFLKKNVFEDKHAISQNDLKLFNVVNSVQEVMKVIRKSR